MKYATNRYKLLYKKQVAPKIYYISWELYSHLIITYNKNNPNIFIYVLNHFTVYLKLTKYYKSSILQFKNSASLHLEYYISSLIKYSVQLVQLFGRVWLDKILVLQNLLLK